MRGSVLGSIFAAVAAASALGACGSGSNLDVVSDDAGTEPSPENGSFGASDAAAKPSCVGLACKKVDCGGGTKTSISGVVWDPAGKNPVYNAVVYVPNAPLAPIQHGAVCDSCGGAPVTGSPVATTLTDATGAFRLDDVPVADDLPLVIQIGKWRRQITVPDALQKCADNPVLDPNLTRLPRNKGEGDMPLIALTSGCDPIHTLVQKIGIDKKELTDRSGGGMVHVYAGKGSAASTGVSSATDAYAFWGSLAEMMKYDIIINECECSPYPRDTVGPAYENMRAYLDAGGRVFNSHYHLNFFGASEDNGGKAAASLKAAASWSLWGKSSGSGPYLIDTTFPKGKAMDDWLSNLPFSSKWGASIKTSPRGQLATSGAGDIGGTVPGISQRWIYPSSGSGAVYISINTPTNKPPADRCGRAVATDLHVGNGQETTMSESEAALEFMFFDLASCVIDDHETPTAPPPK